MENEGNFERMKIALIAIVSGMMVVALALLISLTFQFNLVQNLVMSWILTTGYAIFAFFLIQPIVKVNPVEYIEKQVIQQVEVPVEVEKEVIKEVPVQIPVENKTIEVVEKPVYIPIEKIKIVRKIIKQKQRARKLNIPKYKFIGSKETRTFHSRYCRLGKLIKKKYKVHSNTKISFKRKHFKGCKICIKHLRKA